MKRTFITALALLAFLPSLSTAREFSWAEIVKKVYPSIVTVQHLAIAQNEHGISDAPPEVIEPTISTVCTGFIIDSKRDFAMTAYHCLKQGTATDVFIDGEPTRLMWASKELDAAVLSVKTRKPAMVRSLRPLEWATPVATLGYGYGLSGALSALFRAGYVANPNIKFPQSGYPDAVWFMFDNTFIGGMSGGAVFDVDGKVVSIVQMGDANTGIGRPIAAIYAESSQYWQ